MSGRISQHLSDAIRQEYLDGYSITYIAQRWGISEASVKKHAGTMLNGKLVLPGTEVHIEGQRGRWEFRGGVGKTKDGQQYADFINTRTGRARTFYTTMITTIHRKTA